MRRWKNAALCHLRSFDDSVILAPGAVTGNHEMYKVLRRLKMLVETAKEDIPPYVPAPNPGERRASPPTPVSLNYPQQAFDAALFPVEENAVIAQLRQFARRAQTSMRYGAISCS